MPKARPEHGLHAIEAARKALAAQAAAGKIHAAALPSIAREPNRSSKGITAIEAGLASIRFSVTIVVQA